MQRELDLIEEIR